MRAKDTYVRMSSVIEDHWLLAGIMTAVITSFIINPIITPIIVPIGDAIGLYDSPDINVENNIVERNYDDGAEVERLDGLVWNDSYVEYQVIITNNGETTAQNIESHIYLPGCLVANSERWTSEKVSIRDPIPPDEITEDDKVIPNTKYCSQVVNVGSLQPGEEITATFVADRDVLSDNTEYFGLNSNAPVRVDYSWESRGIYFDDRIIWESGRHSVKQQIVENAGSNYSNFSYVLYYAEGETVCSYRPRDNFPFPSDAEGVLLAEEGDKGPEDPCPILKEHSAQYGD